MVPASVGRSDAVQVQIIFNFFRGIKVSIVDSSSKTARFVDEMSLVGIDACDCLPDCESTEYQYALTSSSLRWNILRELSPSYTEKKLLGHVTHATSTWSPCAPWRTDPPLSFGWTRYIRFHCHHLFQVAEVYSMTGNTIIPDYIKSIASPIRNRHYDNLIEMPSEVRSIY